jgi:hypothetical protein
MSALCHKRIFVQWVRRPLFCNRLPRDSLVSVELLPFRNRFCARRYFKPRIELDCCSRQLLQYARVTVDLSGPVRNLSLESFFAHHELFEISAINCERQVGFSELLTKPFFRLTPSQPFA